MLLLLTATSAAARASGQAQILDSLVQTISTNLFLFLCFRGGAEPHTDVEQHGGIPEQRQELFGEVLTHLDNSSRPFLCFRLVPSAAQGEHTRTSWY